MVFLNDNFCVLENPQTMWTSPASIELCVRRIVNSTLSSVVSEALKPPLAPLSHQQAFVGQGSLPLFGDVAPLWGGGVGGSPVGGSPVGGSRVRILCQESARNPPEALIPFVICEERLGVACSYLSDGLGCSSRPPCRRESALRAWWFRLGWVWAWSRRGEGRAHQWQTPPPPQSINSQRRP